jgi:hypothetical protein
MYLPSDDGSDGLGCDQLDVSAKLNKTNVTFALDESAKELESATERTEFAEEEYSRKAVEELRAVRARLLLFAALLPSLFIISHFNFAFLLEANDVQHGRGH